MNADTNPLRLEGLRACPLFESDDLDDTRERISKIMQPHRLLPEGIRRGDATASARMNFVKLGPSGFGTIAFGEAMRVEVEALDDYYLLMFCTSGAGRVHTMGRSLDVDRGNGILCAPGQPFRATLSSDCEQFVMRIDPGTLAAEIGRHPPSHASRVDLHGSALDGWLAQLQLLGGSTDMLLSIRANPRLAQHVERLLVGLFALGHFPAGPLRGGSAKTPVPGFVKRAEDFIHAHCRAALTLEDLTCAVDVSSRSLQQAFRHFKGVTPMQYLKHLRLDLARAALSAAPPSAKVADIALDCGFTHLGRFALAYRQRFGEPPSHTLSR